MLFSFNLKKNPANGHRLLCEAYVDHAPSIKPCEYWYRRFKSGDFNTSNKEREGRLVKFEDAELEILLNQKNLESDSTSNLKPFQDHEYDWVPFEFKPRDDERRFFHKRTTASKAKLETFFES